VIDPVSHAEDRHRLSFPARHDKVLPLGSLFFPVQTFCLRSRKNVPAGSVSVALSRLVGHVSVKFSNCHDGDPINFLPSLSAEGLSDSHLMMLSPLRELPCS